MINRLLLFLALFSLNACAQPVETRVSSSGVGGIEASSFQLAMPDKDAAPELQLAYRLVAKRLAENGLQVSADGALRLEVGLSVRPAHIGIKRSGKTITEPAKSRPSSRCPSQEYRLSVALTRISDGAEQYRASAGEYHCKHGLSEILPILAGKAVADLRSPRGSYVLKRAGN